MGMFKDIRNLKRQADSLPKDRTCPPAALLARDGLSDAALSGPALIEDGSATIYVPPGWAATLDAEGNVILKRES